jgi:predicted patatin/cPLA2 family phospholipase
MELKKRLTAINKRMTPFIESMNQSKEMKQMCRRFENLLDYCEAKEEKYKAKQAGFKSQSEKIYEARKAEEARIAKIHAEENEERMRDQQQAKAQRESAEEVDAGGKPAQADEK